MMNRSIVALLVMLIVHAGALASLFGTSHLLPIRVASHFNVAGIPDGWMPRTSYLWTMAGIELGITVFLLTISFGMRYFPPSTINLPHRDYWLDPSRRRETFDFIFCSGVWMATLLGEVWFGVHLLVVAANASQPVRLSSLVWLVLAAFVLAALGWTYSFNRRFRCLV